MKKITLSLIFGLILTFSSFQTVLAQSVFGPIEAPAGVSELNDEAGDDGIGILIFISNMIKVVSIVGGIWVMFNFIIAGFTYITAAGDSGSYAKIGEKLSFSVTGLLLIVASYTIAGIVGMIVFGDASYIINPEIPTAIQAP